MNKEFSIKDVDVIFKFWIGKQHHEILFFYEIVYSIVYAFFSILHDLIKGTIIFCQLFNQISKLSLGWSMFRLFLSEFCKNIGWIDSIDSIHILIVSLSNTLIIQLNKSILFSKMKSPFLHFFILKELIPFLWFNYSHDFFLLLCFFHFFNWCFFHSFWHYFLIEIGLF